MIHLADCWKWQYFTPVQDGMPKNCSKDVNAVVDYMDYVFTHGTAYEQLVLKMRFGLEALEHGDDVMGWVFFGTPFNRTLN